MDEPPIIAILTQSFLLLPPDKLPALTFLYYYNYNISSKNSIFSLSILPNCPLVFPKILKCSYMVKSS